jgi:hypothetical protein
MENKLNWIDLVDETGRTSALSIGGRLNPDNKWLGVTGGLTHGLNFQPKDVANADKMIQWLENWKKNHGNK